jgi:hypothetical protein
MEAVEVLRDGLASSNADQLEMWPGLVFSGLSGVARSRASVEEWADLFLRVSGHGTAADGRAGSGTEIGVMPKTSPAALVKVLSRLVFLGGGSGLPMLRLAQDLKYEVGEMEILPSRSALSGDESGVSE